MTCCIWSVWTKTEKYVFTLQFWTFEPFIQVDVTFFKLRLTFHFKCIYKFLRSSVTKRKVLPPPARPPLKFDFLLEFQLVWKLRSRSSQLCSFDKHKLGAPLLLVASGKQGNWIQFELRRCGFRLCWPNPNQLWFVFPHALLRSKALIGFPDFSSPSSRFCCHCVLPTM